MSPRLISRSDDLSRLRDEGYEIEVRGGHLVLRHVPYVNTARAVAHGTLISTLALSGDKTVRPDTHIVHFEGDYPCHRDGTPIEQVRHQSGRHDLGAGLIADHTFSNKPATGYADYYEKMTMYVRLLSSPAFSLDPSSTATTFAAVASADETSAFEYADTHASRAGVLALNEKVGGERIAIVGLGGTGSYILDLAAKTPVSEIHLYDGDRFVQHNAFRAPGAASLHELQGAPFKTAYFRGIYSRMHKGIISHPTYVSSANVDELANLDFVFMCVDQGEPRKMISEALNKTGVCFVDVGMGVELSDDGLRGILRTTTSTPSQRAHYVNRASFDEGVDAAYKTNIQIADLNMLNATMAVIKWKKLRGFYADLEREHNSTYTIDVNMLVNDDRDED